MGALIITRGKVGLTNWLLALISLLDVQASPGGRSSSRSPISQAERALYGNGRDVQSDLRSSMECINCKTTLIKTLVVGITKINACL